MKKRTTSFLLAALLLLAALTGCTANRETSAEIPTYEGTWYFAKNGVECRFQDGKIYQDDLHAKEGQTLMGIYSTIDDHIQANLTGVGGIHEPRDLYIVQTDSGQILCDTATGDGTLYFYQDPLSALAALEAAQPAPETQMPSPSPSPDAELIPLLPLEPSAEPRGEDDPPDRSLAVPAPDEPDPPSESVDNSGSGYVWIPKSGSKYHSTSSCSGMKDPTKVTKADAVSKGYTPCKRCH